MVTRHTTLGIAEMLDEINDIVYLEEQRDAIKDYLKISNMYVRFLKWYSETNLSNICNKIDYKRKENQIPYTTLAKNIGELEALKSKPENQQIKILSQLMENISDEEMMLMENIFTRDLKEYYPNIDWSIFKEIHGVVIE